MTVLALGASRMPHDVVHITAPAAALVAMLGSTLPDWIDQKVFGFRKHRTVSHYIPAHLLVMYLFYTESVWESIVTWDVRAYVFWYVFGSLMHVLGDMVCGPIPFLNPFTKHYLLPKMFRVGSSGEWAFVATYSAIMASLTLVRR